ncbi:MAG TPA: nitroreductase [Lichenihabitans sp.]|jgi:nitroreductase|nr:nitroreductase [Lichenihabitans sp.]
MTDTASSARTILTLQARRRSVPPPALAEPGPDAEQLDALLGVAARVPDHGKLVPWRFIVFKGDGRMRAGEIIARIFASRNPEADETRLAAERRRLAHAPVVVAVVSRSAPHAKIPEWEQQLSAGAAAMNLVIAANAIGFATSWLTEWYAYDAEVAAALGLAPHERFAGFVHIGTPTAAVEERVRPVMSEIVTEF